MGLGRDCFYCHISTGACEKDDGDGDGDGDDHGDGDGDGYGDGDGDATSKKIYPTTFEISLPSNLRQFLNLEDTDLI